MRLLTDLPAWAGFSILLLIDIIVLAIARDHDRRQVTRILHSERQRLSSWAEQRADQLAEEKVIERMTQIRLDRANRR
jgi:hypothetical protein